MMNITYQQQQPTTEEVKPKRPRNTYRKTVYINNRYKDVLEFFNQPDSSKQICELIRQEMARRKKAAGESVEVSQEEMIKDIYNYVQANQIFDFSEEV